MNKCKECGKETKTKFCSRSCSATYNNRGVRRHGKKQIKRNCLMCEVETYNQKYCSNQCQINYQSKQNKELAIKENDIKNNVLGKKILIDMYGEQCSVCGLLNIWNGKELKLELDHINGIANDNRIENVRLICPNCHSQTDTYKAKNKTSTRKYRKKYYKKTAD